MNTYVIPGGTLIKINGIPYWTKAATQIEGGTPISFALGMDHHERFGHQSSDPRDDVKAITEAQRRAFLNSVNSSDGYEGTT